MFDARIFPSNLDDIRKILLEKKAEFKGEYIIHDIIFSSKNPLETLDKVFLRLRLVPVNIWNEKRVIVSIKKTELKNIGKQSIIAIKEQFDTEYEARKFITDNYADTFEQSFEFDRKGWQYNLGNDQIDLEDIEAHYSVEFKSPTQEGLEKLLNTFTIKSDDVIKGPSVLAIRDMLKM